MYADHLIRSQHTTSRPSIASLDALSVALDANFSTGRDDQRCLLLELVTESPHKALTTSAFLEYGNGPTAT